jgi:hypothetical protein
MNDAERALGPLLSRAGILVFEYDLEGFLVNASGSCLGLPEPAMEVHAGLVTLSVADRAANGEVVIDRVHVMGRTISVRHEAVRDADGRPVKIVASACDVTAGARDAALSMLAALPAAS